jgi:hypothetical protein
MTTESRLGWFFLVLAATVVMVGLSAVPVLAQTDQYDEEILAPEALAPGPDEQCQGAEIVAAVGPTTDNATTSFEATGETLRVTYQVQFLDEFSSLDITIEDRFGVLQSEFIDESGTDSFIVVTEEPNAFDLITELFPANSGEYAVVVENCAGSTPAPPGGGGGESTIINIPEKPLPFTGGPEIALPTGALLLGTGMLAWTIVRRR